MRLMMSTLSAFAMLAACSDNPPEQTPSAPATPQPDRVETAETAVAIATTDEPITLDTAAMGIAFWEHPSVNYEGMVIAATEAGLVAHTLEDRLQVSRTSAFKAHTLTLTYQASATNAPGQAIAATYDVEAGEVVLYGIDNTTRRFDEIIRHPQDPPRALCLHTVSRPQGTRGPNDVRLLAAGANGVTSRSIALPAEDAAISFSQTAPQPDELSNAPAVDCAVDPIAGAVYLLFSDGRIARFDGNTLSPLTDNPAADDLALVRFVVSDGAGDREQVLLILLEGETGILTLLDPETGEQQGKVRLGAFNETAQTERADIVAAAAGNFGGIYRFGALALASRGDIPAVRLTPVTALGRALGLSITDGANARPRDLTQPADAVTVDLPALPDDIATGDDRMPE